MAQGQRNQGGARKALRQAAPLICCAVCGLAIPTCVTVAHLDQNGGNNHPHNLAWLCQTHHWMFDCGLYTPKAIRMLQARWQKSEAVPDHRARMKDAVKKASAKRRANQRMRSRRASKAWETRRGALS